MHLEMKQIKHHSMRMKKGRNDRRRRMSLLKKLQEKRKIAMEFSDRRKNVLIQKHSHFLSLTKREAKRKT